MQKVLVRKGSPINAGGTRPVSIDKISSLRHEPLDDAVKFGLVIANILLSPRNGTPLEQIVTKILDGLWNVLVVQDQIQV